MIRDKLHTYLYHMPGEYKCPVCGVESKIYKSIRKHFEDHGAVGIQCPACETIKYWYKIPDPRVSKARRISQVYYDPEEYE